jgi:hypothetical protein
MRNEIRRCMCRAITVKNYYYRLSDPWSKYDAFHNSTAWHNCDLWWSPNMTAGLLCTINQLWRHHTTDYSPFLFTSLEAAVPKLKQVGLSRTKTGPELANTVSKATWLSILHILHSRTIYNHDLNYSVVTFLGPIPSFSMLHTIYYYTEKLGEPGMRNEIRRCMCRAITVNYYRLSDPWSKYDAQFHCMHNVIVTYDDHQIWQQAYYAL